MVSQHVVTVWKILTLSVATLSPSPSAIASTCSVKANRTTPSIGRVCQNFGAGAVVLEAEECPSLENAFLAFRTTQQNDILRRLLLLCAESLWPSRVLLIWATHRQRRWRRWTLAGDVPCGRRDNCGGEAVGMKRW
jgi:hypothetical protein